MTSTLQYYIHDESGMFRLELSGHLSGDGAQSVYQAWRTALSIVGRRPVVVDITYVDDADERGRSLLRLWRQHGARIVAESTDARKLAETVLGETLPTPAPKPGWFRRLLAAAGLSAPAENRRAESAPRRGNTIETIGSADDRAVETRLP
jgi:hypothetical protein